MNDNIVEQYTRNGLEVTIHWCDDMNESPLDWATPADRQGNVHYALYHGRYNLPWEIEASTEDFEGWGALADAVTSPDGELTGYNYRFVRWYEHSGIAVSLRDDTSVDDWDAGIVGVIFGETTEDIERSFEPWQAYIQGEIYGFVVTNPKDGEIVDSCCGYFGIDDVKDNANSEADAYTAPNEAKYAKNARELHR